MKNSKPSRRFKPWMIGLLLLVFAGITFFTLEKSGITNFIDSSKNKDGAASGPTKEQKAQQAKADAQAKQDYLDSVSKSDSSSSNTSPNTESSATDTGTLSVTASQSGGTVTVLTQMQGVTAGMCTMTVTNGARNTSQTAQVIYQPEFSSCAGFSIPASTLGTGTWKVSITVTPDSGAALSKETTVEVR